MPMQRLAIVVTMAADTEAMEAMAVAMATMVSAFTREFNWGPSYMKWTINTV